MLPWGDSHAAVGGQLSLTHLWLGLPFVSDHCWAGDSDNQNPSPTQVRALLTTELEGQVRALVCLIEMDVSWMIILNEVVRQRKINTEWYRLHVGSKQDADELICETEVEPQT